MTLAQLVALGIAGYALGYFVLGPLVAALS